MPYTSTSASSLIGFKSAKTNEVIWIFHMINKPFDEIAKDDIEALILNEVAESKTLEYKEQLPGNSDSDKKEFLADIVAFTNTSGGDMIYGVKEKRDSLNKPTGIPQSVDGIANINSDAEIRRLDSILRDGIEPRIANIQIRAIDNFSNGSVILLRMPKSWNSPHMVSFKGNSRFYARNNAGKYQLDLGEIRSAFAASTSLPGRIKDFRAQRIAKIQAGETPILIENRHIIALHIIAIESFASDIHLDITQVVKSIPGLNLLDGHLGNKRFNLDGLLAYANSSRNTTLPYYTQLFRNGVIEAIDASLLEPRPNFSNNKYIPIFYLEDRLIKELKGYLNVLNQFKLNPPFLVMLSLIGVMDFILYLGENAYNPSHEIDRNILAIPDILIEDYGADLAHSLRSVFDALWQSAGMERSLSYDEVGNWIRTEVYAR